MSKKTTVAPKTRGRPTLFTDELALEICTRLSEGQSLRTICEHHGMPHRKTIRAWGYGDPEFAARYARARAEGMYVIAEDAMDRARNCTNENAAAVRVYVDTVKWFASKMAPAVFGDRVTADIKAEVATRDVKPVNLLQAAREIAFALHLAMREAAKAKQLGEES
jgi:hypothetical protein